MRSLMAFVKKEWQESIASYRLVTLVILFSLFGLMNVFVAKYTPEIIANFVSEEFAKAIPTPTLIDAWIQFFKNIGQVGMIVAVILFSGTLTSEYTKGTLTLLVTKGLSRWKIVIAKSFIQTFVFTLAYVSSILLTGIYGWIYFEPIVIPNLVMAISILWLFMWFLIGLIGLGSVLFRTNYFVLLFVGGINVILIVLNMIPKVVKYNPISLGTSSTALIQGTLVVDDLKMTIIVTIGLVILIKTLTIILFNKKAL